MSNTLTKKELSKYLGPAVVSASDYQSYMWRLESEKGKSSIVKCSREDNCIHYYIDDTGVEHRDGLFNVEQLPVSYRSMKYLLDGTDGVNTNTKLSYDLACMLFGDPEVDPDIPFIYKWNRGDYTLENTGNVFSVNRLGEDVRETVQIIGNLPLPYRQVLDSQKVSSTLMPLDTQNKETLTYANDYLLTETATSDEETSNTEESTYTLLNEPQDVVPEVVSNESVVIENTSQQILTVVELSPKDIDSLLLQNMGYSSTSDEELEDKFKSPVTLLAEEQEKSYEESIATNRKQIVVTQEPAAIPEAPKDFIKGLLPLDEETATDVVAEEVESPAPVVKEVVTKKKLGRPKKVK